MTSVQPGPKKKFYIRQTERETNGSNEEPKLFITFRTRDFTPTRSYSDKEMLH
jgi:hypothetical protein